MEILLLMVIALVLLVVALLMPNERERPPVVIQVKPETIGGGDNLPLIVLLTVFLLFMTGLVGFTLPG